MLKELPQRTKGFVDMEVANISFSQFRQLQAVEKNFVVLFSGCWQQNTKLSALSQIASTHSAVLFSSVLFTVDITVSTDLEQYVVEELKVKTLPVAAVFVNGKLYYIQPVGTFNIVENSDISALLTGKQVLQTTPNVDYLDKLLINEKFSSELVGTVFVSGDRSSVGKSSICLTIISSLLAGGVSPNDIAYIKPVTQCEAEQPVARFCNQMGIENVPIGPVVFYQGFTRCYLAGETDSSNVLKEQVVKAVTNISEKKRFVVIDGVGYPSVGSICGISNADVASELDVPVLLVGKSGVGDAVDSYNMNAAFFQAKGVHVLGGIFNKLPTVGYYNVQSCAVAVNSFFEQYKPDQKPYGFIPAINSNTDDSSDSGSVISKNRTFEQKLLDEFLKAVDINRMIHDVWIHKILAARQPISKLLSPTQRSQAKSVVLRDTTTSFIPSLASQRLNANKENASTVSVLLTRKRTREEVEAVARKEGAKAGG